ncbi:TIGR01459 family HAD-type hydrolase [Tistrella bauzanensis]|uniref:TIGR01459 family HAD-type hydrolase n=1 Tax=Tistrella arctica TaxID=3133430 RepID=A0ABU9YGN6_9PROT
MSMTVYDGVAAIAPAHDGFILDLWGVIHDGRELYPGAVDCLTRLRDGGRRIVFLTNAPRRAARVIEQLDRFGVDRGLYDGVVSSGETARDAAAGLLAAGEIGRRVLHLGPPRDAGLLDGLDFTEAADAEGADLVLNTGFDDEDPRLEPLMPALQAAAARGLPMICANPDMVIVRLDGSRFPCAGLMAQAYENLGGRVIAFGKPFASVYDRCLGILDLPRDRVAAVGDGPHTDIQGATDYGIPGYFIAGGILAEKLGLSHGAMPDPDIAARVCAEEGFAPTAMLPAFIWGR